MKKPRYLIAYYWTASTREPYTSATVQRSGHGNMIDVKVFTDGKPTTITPDHIPGLVDTIQGSLRKNGITGASVVITGWQRYETDAD